MQPGRRNGGHLAESLFHICQADAWNHARLAGAYQADSLHSEGFIHLSSGAQWPRVRQERFSGVPDLVLLEVDPTKLRWQLIWEGDPERFPHLYGPLNLDAVVSVEAI